MRLTRHTDYALRVLIYLSVHPAQRVSIRNVADAYGISHNHLTKVAQRLQRGGWISTARGQGGGIALSCRPAEINVGEVARQLEPADALVECMGPDGNCPIAPACGLQGALADALEAFMKVLDGYTLEDLAGGRRRGALRNLLQLTEIS